MRDQVLGIDVGGSSVKVWSCDGRDTLIESAPLEAIRHSGFRVEFDPATWWRSIRDLTRCVVGRRTGPYAGVVVSSLRQGFVLTDGASEVGRGILNSDRRGAAFLKPLRDLDGLYELTGHWPAPELTLPKLLALRDEEPDRWAAARRVFFLHDWLVWRLSGADVTEISYACAGQLADVRQRTWAASLLDELGLGTAKLAPVVEPGKVVGRLRAEGLGLSDGVPVVAGCGDTQLAAMGAGGLRHGTVTIVAGSSTPIQAASATPLADPMRHPWVSTHARRDLWTAETNAGYPGTMAGWLSRVSGAQPSGRPGAGGLTALVAAPEWSEEGWSRKPPTTILGLRPDTAPPDLAQAFAEGHAYAVRANVEDLERALGRPATGLVLTGGAARGSFPRLCADVTGRPLLVVEGDAAPAAGWSLVTGERMQPSTAYTVDGGDSSPYAEAYARYVDAYRTLRQQLPEEDA